MAYSKPLPTVKRLKFRESYMQYECENCICKTGVRFVFDGVSACNHHICGYCLSCSYIAGEKLVYCQLCAAENLKHVSGVSYEYMIKTFTKANVCTTCFMTNSKAIYEGECGHLLCQKCVHDLNIKQTSAVCSVRKCSTVHETNNLKDLLIWANFTFPKFKLCIRSCKAKADVAFRLCSHGYCFACLEKLLEEKTEDGPSNLPSVRCDRLYCQTLVPTASIRQFLIKLKDDCFLTAISVEISSYKCNMCNLYDRTDVSKARLQSRFCTFGHSFCIDCIQSSISQRSSSSTDDQITCSYKRCKNKTPNRCFRQMIDVVKHSILQRDVFIRKALMDEECSKCNREKGVYSRIVCDHALCSACLNRIVKEEKMWYHECEGEYGTCKHKLPLSILNDLQKIEQNIEKTNTVEDTQEPPDHYFPPEVYLEKDLDEQENRLTLKAKVFSCLPLENGVWQKNGKNVKTESNPKYHVSRSLEESIFTISRIDKTDEGTYTFSVQNCNGNAISNNVYFSIPDAPPVVLLSKTENKYEQSVTFYGKIKSTNPIRVTWMKNEKILDISNKDKYFQWNIFDNNPELTIYSVDKTDEGEYHLLVQNNGGEGQSNYLKFHIETGSDRPKIKVRKPHKDLISIHLAAEVESEWPVTSINWYKNGKIIRTSEGYASTGYPTCPKLQIFNSNENGAFQVYAENVAGITKSDVIQVHSSVPSYTHLELESFPALERVTLRGETISNQTIEDVTWIKDDKILPVNNSKKFVSFREGGKKPTLMIMDVCKDDEGDYAFIARTKDTTVKSNFAKFKITEEPPKITVHNPIKDGKHTIVDALIEKKTWPVKSLIWEKDGTLVFREEKFVKSNEICTSRLELTDMKSAGLYKVIAESAAGRSEAEKLVQREDFVIPLHPILSLAVDKYQQNVRLSAIFASSKGDRKCAWKKDDIKLVIENSTKYQQSLITENKCELVVNCVGQSDEGEYKVIVTSEFGSEESNGAVFEIKQEPPTIINFNKKEEKSDVILFATFESEWPLKSIVWYKDQKQLEPSQDYIMRKDRQRCSLQIKGSEKSGLYSVELESVAGIARGYDIELKGGELNSDKDMATVVKSKESILLPVLSPYKGASDCDYCDYTAVAKIWNCGHYFCWICLEMFADGPSSDNIVECPMHCQSWMTQRTILDFIQKDKYSKSQTSLYFKLDTEGDTCCTKECPNKAFISLIYCGHRFCADCIENYNGKNMCAQNGFDCQNPPPISFRHLQESMKYTMVNIFLSERRDEKCDQCEKKLVFQIFQCSHKFCKNCIQKSLLPEREGQPFRIGKCIKEGCQEYYKYPLVSQPKQKTESTTNKCESKHQKSDLENNGQDERFTPPDDCKQEKQENMQNPLAQKRKPNSKNDSSEKQKKVKSSTDLGTEEKDVYRYKKSFGLSNVGLSCYRNAILQTLAETPCFLQMLKPYKEKTTWICLLSIVLEKVRAQNTGGQEMVDYLHHFHSEFNERHSEYREFQQEDTLSFLTSILNGVHEEFKTLQKDKDHVERCIDPTSLFRGSLKDKYSCKRCKEVECLEGESFFSLPLPVTESLSRKGKATIGSCIRGFLSKEDIDGIPCSICGSHEITKELMIEKYPEVLVLQICKLEEASNSTFQRNRSHVEFWETFETIKAKTKQGREVKEALKDYRLLSVVEHIGSERSGHYICYVRRHRNNQWNMCDDSYVKTVEFGKVRECEAYLLFYVKRGSEV